MSIVAHQKLISERMRLEENSNMMLFPVDYKSIDSNLQNTVVKKINYITAKGIIETHEWIGTMPLPKSCRYMYGIYFRDAKNNLILGGVEVFVEPSTRQFYKQHPRQAVQLNRGACVWWTPRNTATYFISRCIKDMKSKGIKIVMAYCTQEAGEIGNIYQALSWEFVGYTTKSKSYWLDNHWISERTLADKKAWAKKQIDNERWIDKFKNLKYKTLKPKLRYIKIIGNDKRKDEIFQHYGFIPQPYPKREPAT